MEDKTEADDESPEAANTENNTSEVSNENTEPVTTTDDDSEVADDAEEDEVKVPSFSSDDTAADKATFSSDPKVKVTEPADENTENLNSDDGAAQLVKAASILSIAVLSLATI